MPFAPALAKSLALAARLLCIYVALWALVPAGIRRPFLALWRDEAALPAVAVQPPPPTSLHR